MGEEEREEDEKDPLEGFEWAPDPTFQASQGSVNSAGLYADTLRRGAEVEESPRVAPPERTGIPLADWMHRSDRDSPWTPERVATHRQNRKDRLLHQIENFDDEDLGFEDPTRPTGYEPGSRSDRVALMRRIHPHDLREAMKEKAEEIAEMSREQLGRIPTMEEVREEVLQELRTGRPRLSDSYAEYDEQWRKTRQTLPDDPFAPPVEKHGELVLRPPGPIPRIMGLGANALRSLVGKEPVLYYDPIATGQKRRRHAQSHKVLDRALESPGYRTSFPIHKAHLVERLRTGDLPEISNQDLEAAVDATLDKFRATHDIPSRLGITEPSAEIEAPAKEHISEDPTTAYGQILAGREGTEPTTKDWPESIRELYTSIRGEEGEEGVSVGEEAAFDWTEELAFLTALQEIRLQKGAVESMPQTRGVLEGIESNQREALRRAAQDAYRKEQGGQ